MNDNRKVTRSSSVSEGEQWSEVARLWNQLGPPLRPSNQDIAIVSGEVEAWMHENGAPCALILGVTPELYHLPWLPDTDLLAVDHTQGMIEVVWPGLPQAVACAEWTNMPIPDRSRDIALCDGGIILLDYPRGHHELVRELARIIRPGGLCILRAFVPPKEREMPETVLQDLLKAKIANLNLLKLRLGMAMQQDPAEGTRLKDVWDTIHGVAPDFNELASRTGWPLEHLLAINAYRDRTASYHFLTVVQIRELFCANPGGFSFKACRQPTYELGERCPTIVFRRAV
ncbi:MAG: class I SAM-dependent methyltransferase [Gammaproteobacteria bacterium]|nr:class I SAM-dependent methyltransferase [Gammaproteobacteria bacterium]